MFYIRWVEKANRIDLSNANEHYYPHVNLTLKKGEHFRPLEVFNSQSFFPFRVIKLKYKEVVS